MKFIIFVCTKNILGLIRMCPVEYSYFFFFVLELADDTFKIHILVFRKKKMIFCESSPLKTNYIKYGILILNKKKMIFQLNGDDSNE